MYGGPVGLLLRGGLRLRSGLPCGGLPLRMVLWLRLLFSAFPSLVRWEWDCDLLHLRLPSLQHAEVLQLLILLGCWRLPLRLVVLASLASSAVLAAYGQPLPVGQCDPSSA